MTVEKKLALVQQIRSTYNRNQYDLTNRERILYGRSSVHSEPELSYRDSFRTGAVEESFPQDTYTEGVSFFKLRLLLAAVLFLGVVLWDQKGSTLAGITADWVFDAIAADYTMMINDLMDG
ncbi:MAG: hypothetical protein J6C84_01870 [Lachnospiraceae bacterium]|nr:hypothetical protein [Lachnospiraceae bacterium]